MFTDTRNADEVFRQVSGASMQPSAPKTSVARLTRREVDVLGQVASGLSNKQIAARLRLSEKTIRNHLSRIFEKLEVSNRTAAVMIAMRTDPQIWP